MTALNRKIGRNLVQMRGQALAICLVMACGVATFVLSLSTLASLEQTNEAYYERYRFAEVFTHLKRAPDSLAARIAAIPGVAQLQTRIVVDVNLDVEGLDEPALGRLISLSGRRDGGLNELHLRSGRTIDPSRPGEVLVGEAFAVAHGLAPGDSVVAIVNGRREALRIVGIALSPEYVYQIRPGEILPDDRRFGVFWMDEKELGAAFDMDGAFNDVALRLSPGASEPEVLRRLDALTERYGGVGAYGRRDHPSHRFISNEIRELKGMAIVAPSIFLSVAAFLLNVVVSRLIATQREQIAALRAFGYGRREIAWHYLKFVLVIALAGDAIGIGVGAWLGRGMTHLYTRFFHFPIFAYRLDAWIVLFAVAVSTVAAVAGTLGAVSRAAALPPAEAMRPEAPARYRRTIVERLGLGWALGPAARMILRQLERRPLKSILTCAGIATAVAVLVLGNFMHDAIDRSIDIEFARSRRQDMSVTFVEPESTRAIDEMRRLPGVIRAEPTRTVAVRIRHGQRSRNVGLTGVDPTGELFRLVDLNGRVVPIPPHGLAMSAKLAELLEVGVGDAVAVEVLEERRPVLEAHVVALIDDFSGTSAHIDLRELDRLMRRESAASGAFLAVDPASIDLLYRTLKRTPGVAGVAVKEATLRSFRDTVAENLLRLRLFNVVFACVIAFGVVYNTARISLSERSRDLATLRVMGFTRAEVSMILLGELALLTLVAIPGGLALGYSFAALATRAYDTELFRIPLVVDRWTYGFAASVVLAAATISSFVVRRHIDRLELVGVLKTRE